MWFDNMTAVKWRQQVELMRVESRIEDYRHDKDKTATVLRALIKSLKTEREARVPETKSSGSRTGIRTPAAAVRGPHRFAKEMGSRAITKWFPPVRGPCPIDKNSGSRTGIRTPAMAVRGPHPKPS